MKKIILRNIAIVSAVFIATFSIMLVVNYFQVRGATPLQTEVVETLKEINDQNVNNPALQEQIRYLGLLARKAYFVRMEYMTTGVYILLGMLIVFVICIRLFFAKDKSIPDKEIDPVDEWAVKTKARKYITWITTGCAAVAVLFALLSSPYLKQNKVEAPDMENVTTVVNGMRTGEVSIDDDATDEENAVNVADTDSAVSVADGDSAVNVADTESVVNVADGESKANVTDGESKVSVTDGESKVNVTDGTSVTPRYNAFRGNNSSGVSTAKGLPVKWDLQNDVNIAWKRDVPRKGFNSPVINGNRVLFTGADEQARELFCYNLITGEPLWSLVAADIPGSPSEVPKTSDDTGLAASGVATDGNKVCAIFATGDIICADMDGKQLWAKNLGVPEINYGYASSLLIYGSTVIVQYDQQKTGKVLALDLATGVERWSKNRTEKYGTWSSPVIAYVNNIPQLVLMGNPAITAYNPNNGEQLWRVECMSGEVAASPCSANGIIFGASEHAKMVAINGIDGSVLWDSHEFLPEVSSPVATKDNLYVATVYGIVASFDTQTGALRKEHELDGSAFYSSPIIAEGKIYLFDVDGKMFVFTADDEFRLINSFATGENTFATPAFTDGRIVVKTEKSIYCVVNK